MEELRVIQGDTVNTIITITNSEEMEISRVVFSCPSLSIEKDLVMLNQDDIWNLVFTPVETASFWVGRWDFDITVFTTEEEIYTVICKGQLFVEHKRKIIQPIPPGVITGIGWTED